MWEFMCVSERSQTIWWIEWMRSERKRKEQKRMQQRRQNGGEHHRRLRKGMHFVYNTWACLENCLRFALFISVNTFGALVPRLQTRSLSSFVYLLKISRTFSCTLCKYYIESSFMDYLIAIWLRLWPVYFSCALCSVCQFNSFINYYRIELVLQRGLFHYLVIPWYGFFSSLVSMNKRHAFMCTCSTASRKWLGMSGKNTLCCV